ncbi:NADH:flavin oxidoreductase/NADH oxidase [Ethanoligenens harbinense YUAN-3]|uniref:NADH:flavin oxidoreductase/NADH oxidase n=2 Tax=Ethanoligenens harbinense TaxID=253239 RepID=E6U7S6_ETHHY|nr:NADH:flavin oxidoreductase/NADH oxidase [Ethanoligenens harbinense YUAN-3]AVQ97198.1 NADPH dehydrogenase NamA [Ethanoligenens harbinense YUAN-3]AYF39861.1 NADPH dehydrogenase NamA [Ethanoligenens harbinense]AYF42693.1 NADPH dehydrogenase NamA [Ethanoligenens harbinense]QCN93443.1 NADPH dehydrogenase NamA [Ethanoligenens harbinense]
MMKLFEPFNIRELTLKNRIVMPPMCMYQAGGDGLATPFHVLHYGTRAQGGAGLVIVESTGVLPEGRISDHDLGLWNDTQADALREVADAVHQNGAKIAVQLGHAGRKSTCAVPEIVAPSALAFNEKSRTPAELTVEQIHGVADAFAAATKRAADAGFDAVEVHAAHGYLLHEFLSPLTNRREDAYGGTDENRVRLLREVLAAVREVWGGRPLWMRVSAFDYADGGIDGNLMVIYVNAVRDLVDLVHVSTGGLLPVPVRDYPGYQVPFAERIRAASGLPTIAVGKITTADMAEEILQNGRADLVAIGRELLRNPYWPVYTAQTHGVEGYVPEPYARAFPRHT